MSKIYRPAPLAGTASIKLLHTTSLRPDGGFYSAVRPPGESGGIYMTAAGSFSGNGTYWFRSIPTGRHAPRRYDCRANMCKFRWPPSGLQRYVLRLSWMFNTQPPPNCARACVSSNRFENVFRRRQPFRTRAAIPSCTDGIPEVQFHRTTTLPGREETVRNRLVKGRLPD